MGDMADYYIDIALSQGDVYSHGGWYKRSLPYDLVGINVALARDYWIDHNGRKLYPERAPKGRGMKLSHILNVKALLIREYGLKKVKGTTLWKALCNGERMHEEELRKSKSINEGTIVW